MCSKTLFFCGWYCLQNPKTASMVQDLIKEGAVEALRKCFASRMEFGTAGLRAAMGAGVSCMNDLTIIQTTQVSQQICCCSSPVQSQTFIIQSCPLLLDLSRRSRMTAPLYMLLSEPVESQRSDGGSGSGGETCCFCCVPSTAGSFSLTPPICFPWQGLCRYLEESFGNLKERGVVIGYDARAHPPSGGSSKRFASLAAAVFISKGVPVHLFSDITPTPFVVKTSIISFWFGFRF